MSGPVLPDEVDMDVPEYGLRVLELVRKGAEDSLDIVLDEIVQDPEGATATFAAAFVDNDAPVRLWVRIIEETWRLEKWKLALDLIEQALRARSGDELDAVPLLCMKATYNLVLSRSAPKMILPRPRSGNRLNRSTLLDHPESALPSDELPKTKEYYIEVAVRAGEEAYRLDRQSPLVLDMRANLLLARGKLDEAQTAFDALLSVEPSNLHALMGKARALMQRRSYAVAIKCYQNVLAMVPNFLPDPRVGISLCYWMQGEKAQARKGWERSLLVNPKSKSTSALVLLGLSYLNTAKDVTLAGGDEARAAHFDKGMGYITAAWKKDNTISVSAGALSSFFLMKRQFDSAMKLAERTVQFADARSLLSDGHAYAARILHAQGLDDDAVEAYTAAAAASPDQLQAVLGAAQAHIRAKDYPAAANMFETVLRRTPQCIEALAALAAIHTHLGFTNHSVSDSLVDRKKAKELYDQVTRLIATTNKTSDGEKATSERVRALAQDPDLFLEIARLSTDEVGVDRSLRAYKESARISTDELEVGAAPRLLNNIGVLEHQKGNVVEAQTKFEEALMEAGRLASQSEGRKVEEELDTVMTVVSFNHGVVSEAMGDTSKAKEAYDQILSKHPEYVDAKARLALVALSKRDYDLAHNLIKEGLSSQPKNLELRALYTYFLLETKAAPSSTYDFTVGTLRDQNRHDLYSLCAAGSIQYTKAREMRDPAGVAERTRVYVRAAEYFEKALLLDPSCAFAAQGLAIGIAEGTIGTGIPVVPGVPVEEHAVRSKNSRDALTILTKLKDAINSGSVYVNIGHCHFVREEWEKAIESYATASKRYFGEKDVPTLLYLARSWYHKAGKDKSFSDLRSALEAARAARALQPHDLGIIFNVAIIQQTAAVILLDLQPHRRTLAQLQIALVDVEESTGLFEKLANDKSENIPYAKDMPYQRQRYGQTLARRFADVLTSQAAYEASESSKIATAVAARVAERDRLASIEAERQAQLAREAEALAEQRRVMRQQAALWVQQTGPDSDDEKKPKAPKKRKPKEKREGASSGEDDEKPKSKKRPKKAVRKRAGSGSASGSGMELDEDGEEKVRSNVKRTGKNKGQAFKSKEFISDSEEEEEAVMSDKGKEEDDE